MDLLRMGGVCATLTGLVLTIIAASSCEQTGGQSVTLQADAGRDVTVNLGTERIPLDGSLSHGRRGAVLSYTWEITQSPPGSDPILERKHAMHALILPDKPGLFRLKLTITDGDHSSSDMVSVHVNALPVAVIHRPDRDLPQTARVLLDGSRSYDPDGQNLRYRWTLLRQPDMGWVKLYGDNQAIAELRLSDDVAGDFEVELAVNDGMWVAQKRMQLHFEQHTLVYRDPNSD